jgi:hypothetical protein
MLIDRYLPVYDFNEIHSRVVHAPAARVYEALMTVDLGRPIIIRILMGLRSLPGRLSGLAGEDHPVTLRNVDAAGFTLLGEDPPREVLVGVEGRFWTLVPDMCSAESSNFEKPVPEGLARAVWNFSVEPRRIALAFTNGNTDPVWRRCVAAALRAVLDRGPARERPHSEGHTPTRRSYGNAGLIW